MTENSTKSTARNRSRKEDMTESGTAPTIQPPAQYVLVSEIEAHLDKAIAKALTSFEITIKKFIDERFTLLEQKLLAYDERFKEIEKSLEGCHSNIHAIESRVTDLETGSQEDRPNAVTDEIKKDIVDIKIQVNDLEQYGRRSNIRIFGISIQENEDCAEKVVAVLKDKLNCNELTVSDIENAHPLPIKSASADQIIKPAVIVRMKSRQVKEAILKKRKALKGTGISISEDLTSLNVLLLNRLRNDSRVVDSWSNNGRIYFRVEESKRKLLIEPFQSLNEVLLKNHIDV